MTNEEVQRSLLASFLYEVLLPLLNKSLSPEYRHWAFCMKECDVLHVVINFKTLYLYYMLIPNIHTQVSAVSLAELEYFLLAIQSRLLPLCNIRAVQIPDTLLHPLAHVCFPPAAFLITQCWRHTQRNEEKY